MAERGQAGPVRLVVSDVDGTLLTPDRVVTPRARTAVRAMLDAGIRFTIASSRPLRGLTGLIEELQLQDPVAAFNGGLLAWPDLSVIREHLIPGESARAMLGVLEREGMDAWVYTRTEWLVRSATGPHVDRESRALGFAPSVTATFEDVLGLAVKIVGVSDDPDGMARAADEVRRTCGPRVSATQSQPYYLDVTHPLANKAEAVASLAELAGVPIENIATIGDMPTDALMFTRSGVSIAMGNASAEVRHAARFVTAANTQEGFAQAMERFVLAPPLPG